MHNGFWGFYLTVILMMTTPLFAADVVTLTSGKVVEGKILKSDDKSVTIDNGTGIGVSYYADEIKDVNGKPLVIEQANTKPVEKKLGQFLDEKAKKLFLSKIIYLKDQKFTSATCKLNVGSLDKYDQMLNMVAASTGGLFKVKINWDDYKIIISPSETIKINNPSFEWDVQDAAFNAKMSESGESSEEMIKKYTKLYQDKLAESLAELNKGIIKVTTMILGNDKEFRVANPEQMPEVLL